MLEVWTGVLPLLAGGEDGGPGGAGALTAWVLQLVHGGRPGVVALGVLEAHDGGEVDHLVEVSAQVLRTVRSRTVAQQAGASPPGLCTKSFARTRSS